MFQFLFKYPIPVFTKGRFVLLGAWPAWLLPVLIAVAAGGLALLMRWQLRDAAANLRNWRAWAIWGAQSALVALVLLLLWQPAMTVAELRSQQNIIAVVVDDSRSMAIADSNGKTREAAAVAALEDGVLAGLKKRFQTRVYRLGGGLDAGEEPRGDCTHRAGHAHRRQPEATGRGDGGPAGGSGGAAERRRGEHGGAGRPGSGWTRCRRCATAGCRCTRSALARRSRRTMWRWKT